MVTATAAQGDWLAEAEEVQRRIEDTNALVEKEWGRIREAGAGAAPRLDAGELAAAGASRGKGTPPRVTRWLAGDYDMRAAAIRQCLSAIKWRLNIIIQWMDTVMARLPEGLDLRDEEVAGVLRSVRPSLDEVEALFQEIEGYLSEVNRLVQQMNRLWFSAVGRVLMGLAALALGVGAGEVIYRVIS